MKWMLKDQMISLEFYSPEKFLNYDSSKVSPKFKKLDLIAGSEYLQIIVHVESHLVILFDQISYWKLTIEEVEPVFLNSICDNEGLTKLIYEFPWEKYIKVAPTSATLNPRISMAK